MNRTSGLVMGALLFGAAFGIAAYRDMRMRPMPASAYYTAVVRYTHAAMRTTRSRGSPGRWRSRFTWARIAGRARPIAASRPYLVSSRLARQPGW